jgi:hypothetical protein
MSNLIRSYQPIRHRAFVYGGAFDKLNSAFSRVRFSGSYGKNWFSRMIFASSCITTHPGELRLRTAFLSNIQQDTDNNIFPSRTKHQLNHCNPFMNLFYHQKQQEIKAKCRTSLNIDATLVTPSFFPTYVRVQLHCVVFIYSKTPKIASKILWLACRDMYLPCSTVFHSINVIIKNKFL